MSGNMSRRKGATAERAVVAYLNSNGFPHAERRGSGFSAGDVIGIPGVTIEIKNKRAMDLAGWLDQLLDEMTQDANHIGAVVHKRRGMGNPADWYATVPMFVFTRLLAEAGYGIKQ